MNIAPIKEKVKQISLFFLCRLGVLTNRYNKDTKFIDIIDAADFNVDILCETTNTIICLTNDKSKFYFRESKKHYAKKIFIDSLNSDYKSLKNVSLVPYIYDLKKFMNMGFLGNQFSPVRKFYDTFDPSIIGINNIDNKLSTLDLKSYVDYSWSEIYNYKLNAGQKKGDYQTYNSSRAICFYLMSKLLGIDSLIPKTKYIRLRGLGNERFGTLMEAAQGISFNNIAHSTCRKNYSPLLQKNLLNLNILDTICFEKDHRPDNYNIVLNKDKKPESICAFDNDSPMSFIPTRTASFMTYEGCSPLIDKTGFINRPFLDAKLCKKLEQLRDSDIRVELKDYLNKYQITCLISRVNKIKKAITKSVSNGKCILVQDDLSWNEDTVTAELNGNYGLTYLGLFSSDWVNET